MSERFTAIIKIVKVEETTKPNGDRGVIPNKDTELAAITVRGKSLAGLVAATKGHLDLVVDTEDVK